MPTVKGLLRKYDIRPRKRLSQSFLIDPNITSKIAALLDPGPDDTVVEIGSGLGVLTGIIAPRVKKIIAVEIDPDLVEVLKSEISRDNVAIVHEDFLDFDFPKAVDGGALETPRVKVIGNVPYNISSAIVFRLLDFRRYISTAVLMLQKEVAERIAAAPGSKDYGIVSVIVQMYAGIRRELIVPPGCFYPRPKVDSAVIRMAFRDEPLVDLLNPELFRELVRTSFARRRKTLLNNLKSSRFNEAGMAEQVLNECGIDGRRRAESLSPEEFGLLSNVIDRVSGASVQQY
jgi:16S rRNA (adenine1518-N6/adenine1519-N6)-dimethyltransferase